MTNSNCIFCKIVGREAPAHITAEWPDAIAIVPLNPVTFGHTLVIPKRHVSDAVEDPHVTGAVMTRAAQLGRMWEQFNLITSIGPDATQTVFHLHVHIVPRRERDGLHLPWTGQTR